MKSAVEEEEEGEDFKTTSVRPRTCRQFNAVSERRRDRPSVRPFCFVLEIAEETVSSVRIFYEKSGKVRVICALNYVSMSSGRNSSTY